MRNLDKSELWVIIFSEQRLIQSYAQSDRYLLERVTRTQLGSGWIQCTLRDLDTRMPLGSRFLLLFSHHWVSAFLSPLLPLPPHPPSTSCLWFLLTQMFCFLEAHFIYSCPKTSFTFSFSIRWLILCILPFQFPRGNLIGLPNYQSHWWELFVPGHFLGWWPVYRLCALGSRDHLIQSDIGVWGSCLCNLCLVRATSLSRASVFFPSGLLVQQASPPFPSHPRILTDTGGNDSN